MKEDYVSSETEKLLKAKGFPNEFLDKKILSCIHQSVVMKWLRKKHNIHIEVEVYYCEDGQMWLAKIQRIELTKTILIKTCMVNNTYENAVESAIKYCLTNLI